MVVKYIIDTAIARLDREQQSEWTELQLGARDPLDTLSSWTPEHRATVRMALVNYASWQSNAREVMHSITTWSPRLGVALACVVARELLSHVPVGESRPLRAIETAERWTRWQATAKECKTAYLAAFAASKTARVSASVVMRYGRSFDAAAAAAGAAASVADSPSVAVAAGIAAECAYYVAEGASCLGGDESTRKQSRISAELRRLCQVIAESLRTGSVGEWIG